MLCLGNLRLIGFAEWQVSFVGQVDWLCGRFGFRGGLGPFLAALRSSRLSLSEILNVEGGFCSDREQDNHLRCGQ